MIRHDCIAIYVLAYVVVPGTAVETLHPTLSVFPDNPVILDGTWGTFRCLTQGMKLTLPSSITFFEDGKPDPGGGNTYIYKKITGVGTKEYMCRFRDGNKLYSSAIVKLTVVEPLQLSVLPANHINSGDSATLTCSLGEGVKGFTYIFSRDGKKISEGLATTLKIAAVKTGDSGLYTCTARLTSGHNTSFDSGDLNITVVASDGESGSACTMGGTCLDPNAHCKAKVCTCANTHYLTPPTCTISASTPNVSYCDSTPCKNGAACSNNVTGFLCSCSPGYTGKTCSTNVDDCSSNPCQKGTICVDMINDFSCLCVPPKDTENSCQDTGNTLCTDYVLTTLLFGLALFYN